VANPQSSATHQINVSGSSKWKTVWHEASPWFGLLLGIATFALAVHACGSGCATHVMWTW